MIQVSASLEAEPTTLTDVKSEQIRILYAAIPSSLLAILLSSFILATVQWSVIEHNNIIIWFISTNLLSLYRLNSYLKFRRQMAASQVSDSWYQTAIVTSALSGVSWGIAGFFLFPEYSLEHQVFLAFVLAGMSAGAITTLSAILLAARVFVIVTGLPIILKFSMMDSSLSLPMTIMSLLFMAMILVSARRLHQTIIESLNMRYQRELAEQTIRYQALYDDLTELPNRRQLLITLHQEMAKAERHQRYGAILFIDLDRFKSINDSLGHAIGDELLVQVARKISSRLRKEDTAARLGGDEFVVLLPEVGEDQESAGAHATDIADELRKLFQTSFIVQHQEIHISISVGIALFPMAVAAEDLLKYADVAMYQAKNAGRDQVRLFSAEMQEAVNQHRIVEKGLRQALEKSEFELYFQAQFNAQRQVIGAEALLRWNHPQKGVIAPGVFIDTAEQTGLIVPIGHWVLRSACEYLARISDSTGLMLSVNVSPRQFNDSDFVKRLKQTILDTGADPHKLKLEITEGMAISNIGRTIDTMQQLKTLGISFSVDDFGTGYSSLSYLNRLPLDELKIDRSFVKNISTSPDNAVIVDTILVMAQHLQLAVVAEGVETEAELIYLMQRECDFFQGYYFSRPEPFEYFIASIKT